MKTESFEDLVSLYFDEALDPEGIAELNRLLIQPGMAARFLHLSRVHGGMRELSSVPAEVPAAFRARRPWAIPAAAAAAFLALVFALSRPSARLEQVRGAVTFDGRAFESSEASSATTVISSRTVGKSPSCDAARAARYRRSRVGSSSSERRSSFRAD